MTITNHNHKLKLICPNKSCINKSPVYRRFDKLRGYECKACGFDLVRYISPQQANQDLKAKRELKEMNA